MIFGALLAMLLCGTPEVSSSVPVVSQPPDDQGAALAVPPVQNGAAPKPWSAILGSGLLTLPDTRTLPRGQFTVANTLHNRDRDPLGIDMFDYAVAVAVGVTPRIEAYAHGVYSRVVVVPDVSQTSPALPPPPLDLVVRQGEIAPIRPYYALYPLLPYANGRGDQRFSDLVPGDLTVGAKYRFREPSGSRPGFAVNVDLKFPLTQRLNALQSGSGTGNVDVSARFTAERRFGGFDTVFSGAFTYVGSPTHGDQIVTASGDQVIVAKEPLRLPHRMELAAGVRRSVSSHLALVGEMVGSLELAGGTKKLDAAPPLDLLAGIQVRAAGARISLGALYHARALLDGRVRTSPLAGYVDLTRARKEAIGEYLESAGLGAAVPYIRPGVQVAAPLVPGVPIPEGARLIPDLYTIKSQHQLGFVFVLGWSF
jgi:hypothetical protein